MLSVCVRVYIYIRSQWHRTETAKRDEAIRGIAKENMVGSSSSKNTIMANGEEEIDYNKVMVLLLFWDYNFHLCNFSPGYNLISNLKLFQRKVINTMIFSYENLYQFNVIMLNFFLILNFMLISFRGDQMNKYLWIHPFFNQFKFIHNI